MINGSFCEQPPLALIKSIEMAGCYVVDDETVAKTNGTNTRSRAGVVVDVDAQGVWVTTGPGF